ncbi:MAG: cellulase family glycosylhydrolase, partial [Kiritimatiellae bacterium]|nr:cellulase family glycosylhydrolase [Kiritimatiellia bacterium]
MLTRVVLSLAFLLFAGTGAFASAESTTPDAPPALSMLRAENGDIVNEEGQTVHLRAENIGNWLAWEQWIQRFKPDRFFNQLGRIVGEGDKSNRIELEPAQAEGSGTELQELCWQKAATGFGPGDYLRFKKIPFNTYLGAYIFRYVQSNEVPGTFELRADAVDSPLLALIETAYSKGEECHNAEARGLLLTSLDGPHDLYLVARHPDGPSNAAFLHLSLIDIENKASAEELYDLLVDNVDASLTLYATNAQKTSGVNIAYDCQPDGIGGYGNGDFIEFQNVNLPAGLTNLSLIAATGNDHPEYDGRFRIEITDASGAQHLFGEVPLFNSGGWNNYEEYAIYNGTLLPAGPCTIRITGITGKGVGDVGNLHSLRFFRADRANALIERHRDAYFTATDLDWLQSIGINCIRLPFNYDLIMNDAGEMLPEQQWSPRLDGVVAECAKRGMFCILDLHATPGGQNDYEQCMRKEGIRNRLWYVPEHQDRTVRLWAAVARHYKGNPAVAGYDLINEPAPWWHSSDMNNELPARYNQYILPLHRRLYEAIRAEDPDHLIFMEDNAHMTWNARFLDKLPDPQKENWSNVVYEIHSYEHALNSTHGDWRDSDVLTQKNVADENIQRIVRFQNERNVPVFIGEFQPVAPENYDYALRRYNRFGIHWCHWNFKVAGWGNRQFPERGWDHWGLQYRINPHTPELVDLQTDSFDTLAEKFDAFESADFQPNAHLIHVIEPRNRLAGETLFTDLFQTTFAAPDTKRLDYGWCGDMVTLVGRPEAFSISNRQLRIATGDGPAALRLKSRKETEAHFNLNGEGCLFSAAVSAFGGEENASGTELSLCFTRDLITNALSST